MVTALLSTVSRKWNNFHKAVCSSIWHPVWERCREFLKWLEYIAFKNYFVISDYQFSQFPAFCLQQFRRNEAGCSYSFWKQLPAWHEVSYSTCADGKVGNAAAGRIGSQRTLITATLIIRCRDTSQSFINVRGGAAWRTVIDLRGKKTEDIISTAARPVEPAATMPVRGGIREIRNFLGDHVLRLCSLRCVLGCLSHNELQMWHLQPPQPHPLMRWRPDSAGHSIHFADLSATRLVLPLFIRYGA